MTKHKLSKFETVCTGKFEITKLKDVHFKEEKDYICFNCMKDFMNIYLKEMNKKDLKSGKTKLKRMVGK